MINVILNGPGRVGMSFVRLLLERRGEIGRMTGETPSLLAVTDKSGTVYSEEGLTLEQVISWRDGGAPARASVISPELALQKAAALGPAIVVEATPTNLQTGDPGLTNLRKALSLGFSVVSLAKGPLVLAFDELMELAHSKGCMLKYSGAVAAALPTVDTAMYSMAGSGILQIEGVLNGTTNYILNSMMSGKTYGEALAEAQVLGVAEADPALDVSGLDSAAKILILANTVWNAGLGLGDVDCAGITSLSEEGVREAADAGTPVRLVARAEAVTLDTGAWGTPSSVRITVKPQVVPRDHPFAVLPGTSKAVKFTSRDMGDVIVSGGASDIVGAASSALKDLIHILEERHGK